MAEQPDAGVAAKPQPDSAAASCSLRVRPAPDGAPEATRIGRSTALRHLTRSIKHGEHTTKSLQSKVDISYQMSVRCCLATLLTVRGQC